MRAILLTISLFISTLAFAQLPSVKVENAKGESFDTKTLVEAGKPMIVSFWSTSCKPCIRELDAIYDAQNDIRNFEVVLIYPSAWSQADGKDFQYFIRDIGIPADYTISENEAIYLSLSSRYNIKNLITLEISHSCIDVYINEPNKEKTSRGYRLGTSNIEKLVYQFLNV